MLIAHTALELEERKYPSNKDVSINNVLALLNNALPEYGKNDFAINIDILDKRAKYQMSQQKLMEADKQRIDLGLPSTMTLENIIEKQNEFLGLEPAFTFNKSLEDKFRKLESDIRYGRIPHHPRAK